MKAVTTCPRLELEKMQGTKGHTPNTIRARTIIELNLNVVQILQLGGAHLNGNEKKTTVEAGFGGSIHRSSSLFMS